MGGLSGQTVAKFDIERLIYYPNQTVCMGFSKTSQKWEADLCQSELLIQDVQMKCTCNAFDSHVIGLFTDFNRDFGEAVEFPPPVVDVKDQVQQFAVIPSSVDLSLLEESVPSNKVEEEDQAEVDIDGKNYVWMIQTTLVAVLTMVGSLLTLKLDKRDEKE